MARYGLDAMAYARVATGDIDLVIESRLMPHDMTRWSRWCAARAGRSATGTAATDFSPGRVIAAATRALYDEAVALLAG